MEKLTSKKALLDRIRLSEGAHFECDEDAILEEYDNDGKNKSGLAIKVLSIFGGFLATLTFLGFLAISGIIESGSATLVLGILFIIAAIGLNRVYDKLIIETFGISIYLCGLALLAFGLTSLNVEDNFIAVLISFVALCSLMITQNYILSFISILAISGSFLTLIFSNDLYDLIHLYIAVYTVLLSYVFLNEAKIISTKIKLAKLYYPARIGLIISLLVGLIAVGKRFLIPIAQNYIWLSSIVMILVGFYIVYTLVKINEIEATKSKILIYALSGLVLILTINCPSISGTIIIILLSFLVNYRTGFVIGIISFIYFISQYYYDLNLTLLTKSIILFSTGIVFILFYLFTIKKLDINEKI